MTKIAMFTSTYPYGDGEQFIEAELLETINLGVEITIWPLEATGSPRAVPHNCQVRLDIADAWRSKHPLKMLPDVLISREAWMETGTLIARRRLAENGKSFLKKTAQKAAIERILRKLSPELAKYDLLYTYWADLFAIGFAALSREEVPARRIARAHRYDLYDDAQTNGYAPYRKEAWASLDRIYPISEHGKAYILENSGLDPSKVETSRLGVAVSADPPRSAPQEVIEVVSIAGARRVKRLDKAISACEALAKKLPNRQVKWTLLGSGPLIESLRMDCEGASRRAGNFEYELKGQVDHSEVLEYLSFGTVNLLLSLSDSEGIPVSQMEAMERGIKVVSTNVGGVAELLGGTDSVMVPPGASPTDVANVMKLAIGSGLNGQLSRKKILEHYNARKNYREFYAAELELARQHR